jgi:hypothetical protein
LSVGLSRAEVASRADMRRHRHVYHEEAWGVSWGCEPLHAPFMPAGRLVGILGTTVEGAVLAIFHPIQNFSYGVSREAF